MIKILILCTGNSCRSQMAEGFLSNLDEQFHVRSAGTNPSDQVHPLAIKAMAGRGIDISSGIPENVDQYLNESWDYVITVCDYAKETCPVFTGKVEQRLHIGFDDPAEAIGSDQEIMVVFNRVRDEIETDFKTFYQDQIKK